MAQVEGHGPQAPSRLLTSVTFAPRHVHPAMVSYTSTNHEAYLWDFSDLALSVTINDGFRTPLRGHTKAVNGTAFHHSQLGFATASDDWTCRIWDLETLTTVRCYNNDFHFGPVTCASFYDANNPFVVATVHFFQACNFQFRFTSTSNHSLFCQSCRHPTMGSCGVLICETIRWVKFMEHQFALPTMTSGALTLIRIARSSLPDLMTASSAFLIGAISLRQ